MDAIDRILEGPGGPLQMNQHHLQCNGQGPTVAVPRIAHELIHMSNAEAAHKAAGPGASWQGGFCNDPFTLRPKPGPDLRERQTTLPEFF